MTRIGGPITFYGLAHPLNIIIGDLTSSSTSFLQLTIKVSGRVSFHPNSFSRQTSLRNSLYLRMRGAMIREGSNIEAIVDNSFDIAFPKNDSLGLNPWVEGSVLICPGARIDKTQTKHICKFVVIEEDWSWESGHMVNDIIRRDQ